MIAATVVVSAAATLITDILATILVAVFATAAVSSLLLAVVLYRTRQLSGRARAFLITPASAVGVRRAAVSGPVIRALPAGERLAIEAPRAPLPVILDGHVLSGQVLAGEDARDPRSPDRSMVASYGR